MILDDDALDTLGKMRTRIDQIAQATEMLNRQARHLELDIRPVTVVDLALMANDISRHVHNHFQTQDGQRAAAIERMRKAAA